MNKQSHITAITRQNIVDAFWSLYKSTSLEQITIKEIMRKAGYNRGTFYEYFDNVQAVLTYLEDGLIEYMKAWISSDPYFFDSTEETISKITEMYRSKGEYLGVLFGENGNPHFCTRYKAALKPLLSPALMSTSEPDFRQDLALEFSLSGILAVLARWYPMREQYSYEQLARLMRVLVNYESLRDFSNEYHSL